MSRPDRVEKRSAFRFSVTVRRISLLGADGHKARCVSVSSKPEECRLGIYRQHARDVKTS